MIPARAPFQAFRLAGARRILRSLEFPRAARAPALLDGSAGAPGHHAMVRARAGAGSDTASKKRYCKQDMPTTTWIGRVDDVEPGQDDLRLST
jgi:hypothetical protein